MRMHAFNVCIQAGFILECLSATHTRTSVRLFTAREREKEKRGRVTKPTSKVKNEDAGLMVGQGVRTR
jgi:hypothetical protein